MEPFTERTQETHQIYPSANGLSYTITGKDGKREGFIKYDSVESVYVESISRQENQPCFVIQSNGFSAKFPLEKDLSDDELRDLMGTVLKYINTDNSKNPDVNRVFIPR